MGEIIIHLCKGISGEVVRAELPDDVPIPEVMAIIDRKYGLGMGDRSEHYVLYNISQKFEYTPADTLAGRSTAPGDLNILVDSMRCEFAPAGKP